MCLCRLISSIRRGKNRPKGEIRHADPRPPPPIVQTSSISPQFICKLGAEDQLFDQPRQIDPSLRSLGRGSLWSSVLSCEFESDIFAMLWIMNKCDFCIFPFDAFWCFFQMLWSKFDSKLYNWERLFKASWNLVTETMFMRLTAAGIAYPCLLFCVQDGN